MITIALGFIGKDHRGDLHLLADAIESHDVAKEHPDRIVRFPWPRAAVYVEDWFEPARRVIGQGTNGTAGQRCKPGPRSKFLSGEVLAEKCDGGLHAHFLPAISFPDRFCGASARHPPRDRTQQ